MTWAWFSNPAQSPRSRGSQAYTLQVPAGEAIGPASSLIPGWLTEAGPQMAHEHFTVTVGQATSSSLARQGTLVHSAQFVRRTIMSKPHQILVVVEVQRRRLPAGAHVCDDAAPVRPAERVPPWQLIVGVNVRHQLWQILLS